MRMQIFRHLQSLSPSFYDRNPVGRLITRVITRCRCPERVVFVGPRFDFRRCLHAYWESSSRCFSWIGDWGW